VRTFSLCSDHEAVEVIKLLSVRGRSGFSIGTQPMEDLLDRVTDSSDWCVSQDVADEGSRGTCVCGLEVRGTFVIDKALAQFNDFSLQKHQNSVPTRGRRFRENAVEGSDMTNFSDDPVANSRRMTLE